jgi:hypothetical protein
VDGEEVRLGGHLIEVGQRDPALGEASSALGRGVFDATDDPHAPPDAELSDSTADVAQPDDSQRLGSGQGSPELTLRPAPPADQPVGHRDVSSQVEQQGKGHLGDGLSAGAGDPHQAKPSTADVLDVDVVEPGSGPDQEP